MRIALCVILLLSAGAATAADSSACYAISNADARAYCIAKARGQSSACYSIQSNDARSQCLAEVGK